MSVTANGKWERTIVGNQYYEISPDAYLSYNAAPMIGNQGEETAIVVKNKSGHKSFLILMGDWREELQTAAEKDGLGGCLRIYEENKDEYEGSWSTGVKK